MRPRVNAAASNDREVGLASRGRRPRRASWRVWARPAAEALASSAACAVGQLPVASTGPMSNNLLALARDPREHAGQPTTTSRRYPDGVGPCIVRNWNP
jgi:hypothetical protein